MPHQVAWSIVTCTHGGDQVDSSAAWAQWNLLGVSVLPSTRRHNQMASTYPHHLMIWLAEFLFLRFRFGPRMAYIGMRGGILHKQGMVSVLWFNLVTFPRPPNGAELMA